MERGSSLNVSIKQGVAAALVMLAVAVPVRAQTPDQKIAKDYEAMMQSGQTVKGASDDERKAGSEAFKAAMLKFIGDWQPRIAELDLGRYQIGKALLLAARPQDAIAPLEAFTKAHAESDDIEDALLSLGAALLANREYDRAHAVYDGFLASRPKSDQATVAKYYRAIADLEAGRIDIAIAGFDAVIQSKSESPIVADANLKVVQVLVDADRTAEARTRLEALMKAHPDESALVALKEQVDWIGKAAPELDGTKVWIGGDPKLLKDRAGRVVVLTFFAEPYETSRAELGIMQELAATFPGKPVDFVGVTTWYRKKVKTREEETATLRDLLASLKVSNPVAVAEDFALLKAYGVKGVPATYVVGADGRIVHVKNGASRNDIRGLAALRDSIGRALPK